MSDLEILRAIADRLHTTAGSLRAKDNHAISVGVRCAVMLAMRKSGWTLARIGRATNRDVKTVTQNLHNGLWKFNSDGLYQYIVGDLVRLIKRAA